MAEELARASHGAETRGDAEERSSSVRDGFVVDAEIVAQALQELPETTGSVASHGADVLVRLARAQVHGDAEDEEFVAVGDVRGAFALEVEVEVAPGLARMARRAVARLEEHAPRAGGEKPAAPRGAHAGETREGRGIADARENTREDVVGKRGKQR